MGRPLIEAVFLAFADRWRYFSRRHWLHAAKRVTTKSVYQETYKEASVAASKTGWMEINIKGETEVDRDGRYYAK